MACARKRMKDRYYSDVPVEKRAEKLVPKLKICSTCTMALPATGVCDDCD